MFHRLIWTISALTCLSATFTAAAQQLTDVPRRDGNEVPMSIFDASGRSCPPLAVISPGVGGTERGMRYLAMGLRQDGWTAIVLGHRESGPQALRSHVFSRGLRQGLLQELTDPSAYEARFMDIGAALKWASNRCQRPFTVLIGHSMGAATVMLEAGAKNKLGLRGQDRFDAYVAFSPDGPGSIFPAGAWSGIRKPVLILTGTRDKALEGPWQSRTVPFSDMSPGCKALGVIDGASHLNFAGIGLSGTTERLSLETTRAFVDSLRAGHCGPLPHADGMNLQMK
jgi:dienelactone hydrolase